MAAFVFARFAFRGREVLFTLFAIGLMFPFAVAILPLFILLRSMGLLDNPLGVILPQAAFGLPMTIIILRQFFRTIPGEIEEAATLDGCGAVRVLLADPAADGPARPGHRLRPRHRDQLEQLHAPAGRVHRPELVDPPVGVQQFQGQYADDTAKVLAYVVLSMIPALAFYAVAERQLIGGLASGAVKG